MRDITERKRAESERDALQRQLVDSSRQAGMAEMATGVLHNVGNVLNSINVSANLLDEQLRKSSVASLSKASAMINDHAAALGVFVTEDDRGKHLPQFLSQLAKKLESERESLTTELGALMRNVKLVIEIVSLQQTYARVSSVQEEANIVDLVEDAFKTANATLMNHNIEVIREIDDVPTLLTDKHKILQVLVNLISNAKHAISDSSGLDRRLTLRVFQPTDARLAVEVEDTGAGIAPDSLTKIFEYGFTTKKDGHGFGLHSSALIAKELGGALTVRSDGLGCGTTFRFELPLEPEGLKTCDQTKIASAAS
jgi:signal transduction histidine kinase